MKRTLILSIILVLSLSCVGIASYIMDKATMYEMIGEMEKCEEMLIHGKYLALLGLSVFLGAVGVGVYLDVNNN